MAKSDIVRAVLPRPAERRFDVDARLVDEAPVVDFRQACRLARQAGEAPVDVLDGLRRRGAAGMTRGRTPRGATRTFARYDDRRDTRHCIGYGASLLKKCKGCL